LASIGQLQHSGSSYGENLYYAFGSDLSRNSLWSIFKTILLNFFKEILKDATDIWYNEVVNYDYENPGFSIETGHFTQVQLLLKIEHLF
jgi:glioma pathogenesis-related protein 2